MVGTIDAPDFVGNVTKMLPVRSAGEPMYIKYYAFYNKEFSSEENIKIINKVVELLK